MIAHFIKIATFSLSSHRNILYPVDFKIVFKNSILFERY